MRIIELAFVLVIVAASIFYLIYNLYKSSKKKPGCVCDGGCLNKNCRSQFFRKIE